MKIKIQGVSIIIVHYKRLKLLNQCISSIYRHSSKINIEIIVVDNGNVNISYILRKKYPHVKYIKSPINVGYGAGNNIGVNKAIYQNIIILNPDTVLVEDIFSKLIWYLRRDSSVAIVAPTLIDRQYKPYFQIGIKELTPMRAIFVLSFINKLFPKNYISREYWAEDLKLVKPISIELFAGSAFIIKKEIFEKIGGFDEAFFLYFEEADISNRLRKLGYKIILVPSLKIMHHWAATTPKSQEIKKIFQQSRRRFFRKHYGYLSMIIVEFFTTVSKRGAIFFILFMSVVFCAFQLLRIGI